MKNIDSLFKLVVANHDKENLEQSIREKEARERERLLLTEKQAVQDRKLRWLVCLAQQNITSLLSDNDTMFSAFVETSFERHGSHFEDFHGVCGFEKKLAETPTEDRPSNGITTLIILPLYEENIPDSPKQILALAVRAKSLFDKATKDELKDAKLVHLLCTGVPGTGINWYSKAEPVSFDPGFIETLFDLAIPGEMAMRFLVKRFFL